MLLYCRKLLVWAASLTNWFRVLDVSLSIANVLLLPCIAVVVFIVIAAEATVNRTQSKRNHKWQQTLKSLCLPPSYCCRLINTQMSSIRPGASQPKTLLHFLRAFYCFCIVRLLPFAVVPRSARRSVRKMSK